MAIYADKKNGVLTGRWRVELQKGGERYRKRWDSHKEAVEDEKAVLASWAAGEQVDPATRTPSGPEVHTLASVIPLAQQSLWGKIKKPEAAWAHVEYVAAVLGRSTRLDDIDTLSIDKAIMALSKQKLAEGTINRYLSHFRTFLTWCKSRKYRTIPVTEIDFAWRKESTGRIRWITADEEAAIKDYLLGRKHPSGAPQAKAVWGLIYVAIRTGCRLSELLTAEATQINGNRLHLWETKTDTPRTIPMDDETTSVLRNLIRTGTMPTERGLRSWWARVKTALGLDHDDQFVFHVTRHTCATRLVDADVNIFVIKEWMGHKRIETTLRYAHVKPQNLEDALVKVGGLSPVSFDKPRKTVGYNHPHTFPTSGANGAFIHNGMSPR